MTKALMIAGGVVIAGLSLGAQRPESAATCKSCPATFIAREELQQYLDRAIAKNIIDQQVRSLDIGKSGVAVGMVYRGKLAAPQDRSVAEHHQVSEVYHIIDGTATLVLGPDITNRQRRPATLQTVREFNGPGNNGSASTVSATSLTSVPFSTTASCRTTHPVIVRAPTGTRTLAPTGGSGIASADLPHVFDRFYKGPTSTGSGLGLAIARALVLAHGGEITAESAPGAGTSIRIRL